MPQRPEIENYILMSNNFRKNLIKEKPALAEIQNKIGVRFRGPGTNQIQP